VILVEEFTVNEDAFEPPNLTAVAPEKPVPVIVTELPHGPLSGSNDVIPRVPTVKFVVLWFVPFGVVTRIGPVDALFGTIAVIRLGLSTVKVADPLPNFTEVAPVRLFPLIWTDVPGEPLVGENDVISGVPGTVNFVGLVAVPEGVVTLMGPVVVPFATLAVIWVELTTVKEAASVRLNTTSFAPVKLVPLIVTIVPGEPLVGENDVIVGLPAAVTTKSSALDADPSGAVTEIGPVWAFAGTCAVIWVGPFTTKVGSDRLGQNVTSVAPVKFVPVITTVVPTGPLLGEKSEIAGAAHAAGAGSTRSKNVGTSTSERRRNIERPSMGNPFPGRRRAYGSEPFPLQPSRQPA
jgi:hypothetical protein